MGDYTASARILLINEYATLRTNRTEVLKRHGFEVRAAADVTEALEIIGPEKFDALVGDMHVVEDLTLVRSARAANPRAAVIALSNDPPANGGRVFADEVVQRPVTVDSLVKVIRERLCDNAQLG